MFRVIIAGSRYFDDYALLQNHADKMLSNQVDIEIVSGGASGADALGERYAKDRGYKLKIFPADWATHGRKAGPIRNREMAEYADALLAYWDGKSRGTKNMIEEARARDLKISIKLFE